MKTTIYLIAALATSFVAMPAAAECTWVEETGTSACYWFDSASNHGVGADQRDVGGAWHSMYEYEIFGWHARGQSDNVYVLTPDGGYHSVSYSMWCSVEGDGCAFRDDTVYSYSSTAGWSVVTLYEYDGMRTLCVAGAHVDLGCQELA